MSREYLLTGSIVSSFVSNLELKVCLLFLSLLFTKVMLHLLKFVFLFLSLCLELLYQSQRLWQVYLTLPVFLDELLKGLSEFESDLALDLISEWHPSDSPESEEVKVYLIFFKFPSNEFKSISKLIVFVSHFEEIFSADRFDNTVLLGDKFLKLLLLIGDESICTECRTLIKSIKW